MNGYTFCLLWPLSSAPYHGQLDICSLLTVGLKLDLVHSNRLSSEIQETQKMNDDLQFSLDKCYLTPLSYHDLSDSQRPPSNTAFSFDDHEIFFALDEAMSIPL